MTKWLTQNEQFKGLVVLRSSPLLAAVAALAVTTPALAGTITIENQRFFSARAPDTYAIVDNVVVRCLAVAGAIMRKGGPICGESSR